jgi:NodT family efflux transporter outer membrane factor (OMF) lipoprotein
MPSRKSSIRALASSIVVVSVLLSVGCNSLNQWKSNGYKVGPNYCPPSATVAEAYSHQDSPFIRNDQVLDPRWWTVFNDPALNELVDGIYRENLTLKQASWRIEESRALLAAQTTTLLPQQNLGTGSYTRNQNNALGIPVSSDRWAIGFNSGWELDFWGKFRRGVDASQAQLDASIKDYDFALVTLVSDVATLYIQIRSLEERIALAERNIEAFEGSLKVAKARVELEVESPLDVAQAESNLYLTKALIPRLEFARLQSIKALAVLMATPPSEVETLGDPGLGLPAIPVDVVVGIPAELLTRRPDIRSAERNLKAAFEQIGITEAELYPSFSISGNLGYASSEFRDLFSTSSFNGGFGPSFSWNVLSFGRIRQQVRASEARFNQLKFDFENRVLVAQQEVETSMIEFIKAKEEYEFNVLNEKATAEAARIGLEQYKAGDVDFGRVFVVQSNVVQAQDTLVANRASIALALINTYRSLGGGWEFRCQNESQVFASASPMDSVAEVVIEDAAPVPSIPAPINAGLLNATN